MRMPTYTEDLKVKQNDFKKRQDDDAFVNVVHS